MFKTWKKYEMPQGVNFTFDGKTVRLDSFGSIYSPWGNYFEIEVPDDTSAIGNHWAMVGQDLRTAMEIFVGQLSDTEKAKLKTSLNHFDSSRAPSVAEQLEIFE